VMCDTFHPLKLSKFARELDGQIRVLVVWERGGSGGSGRQRGRWRHRRRPHLTSL